MVSSFAYAFTGNGSGTEKDPYQVTTADELFEVRNDLSAHYLQMNDIDLAEWIQEDNSKQGWNPIGDASFAFTGNYNGNHKEITGLYINRPYSDYVGLFGYVSNGNIVNLLLKDSKIIGHNVVGVVGQLSGGSIIDGKFVNISIDGNDYLGLVGYLVESVIGNCDIVYYNVSGNKSVAVLAGYCRQSTINGNIAVLGNVKGNEYVSGGVADYWIGKYDYYYPTNESSKITNNSIQATVISDHSASGIIGKEGYDKDCYDDLTITDNIFCGTLTANIVQGIGGNKGVHSYQIYKSTNYCYGVNRRNIVLGKLYGKEGVYGIAVSSAKKDILNNICAADTITVVSGDIFRISPNSEQNNYANAAMTLIQNGKNTEVEDGYTQGTGYGLKTLKKQSTYEGLGFDFNNHWAIVEGESFPYNVRQSKPAVITSFVSGGKASILGTAEGSGKVYVKIGQTLYESYVLDGKWEVSLGNIRPGAFAQVSVECNGMAPSPVVTAFADRPTGGDTETKAGDANGDGVIDAADVVGIVNHIIGKSSQSLIILNADVNGDGQVLVDDAVGAVELIMNAQ